MKRFFLVALAIAGSLYAANADSHPPVILISIDTLRADHLSAWGYRRVATPNIDSLAKGGTLFENIACQTPLTLPSHTTLLTSTYPFENGIQENAEKVPPAMATLASVLKARGYRTAAFIGSVFLEAELGLDQGFDTYDSPFHFEAFSPLSGEVFFGGVENPYSVRDRRDGELVLAAASRWLNANHGQSAFVFVHLFDLHTPYLLPPEAARQKGISRYDAQLLYVDELVGRFRKALMDGGWWDRSIVALVSDHGEGLGDHGENLHGYFVYQSTLRVPVIVHWPSGAPARPVRVSEPGGLIDVAPSILDALHVPAPPSFHGVSLLGAAPRVVYAETLNTHDAFGWAPLRSVRIGDSKYIDAPRPELYNLARDSAEQHNLIRANPGEAHRLREELLKLEGRYPRRDSQPAPGTPPQTQRLLSSLGYVSRGPRAASASSEPDPKDKLAEYHIYELSMDAVSHRRLHEAVGLLLKILAMDDRNLLAHRDLASCYLDLHEYEKARLNFERVAAAVSNDYASQFGLGMANKGLGRIETARQHFQEACRIAPQATQCRRELSELPPAP
ncbi:MAG TPA: sulfatase-like hydrolase/transferase [Bryobacteraceae bacterium]|nr:sulfatase-like hydrolase/transferase [Bryobacteraceae bacterium]